MVAAGRALAFHRASNQGGNRDVIGLFEAEVVQITQHARVQRESRKQRQQGRDSMQENKITG